MPGFLYNYPTFKNRYESAIVNDQDKETSDRLRRLVHPFILRRLKKDVLKELPDKIEKVVSVHLEGEQKKLYDAYAQRLKLYLAKQSPQAENPAYRILRLRRVALATFFHSAAVRSFFSKK